MGGRSKVPARQIRSIHDEATVTVYQAYSASIALPALDAQTFVAPFKTDRMTWIKPSFLWMMYRCGWGTKPGQDHVLAIKITRSGFEEALASACLSHYDPEVYTSLEEWRARKATSPVRVQWDPERDVDLNPLPWRSLQVGLSGPAVHNYLHHWIVSIDDITPYAHSLRHATDPSRLPNEQPYPLPGPVARVIGATQ